MQEVDDAAKLIYDSVDPSANIIFGATINQELKDEIRITVLATGFDMGSMQKNGAPRGRNLWGGLEQENDTSNSVSSKSHSSTVKTSTSASSSISDDLEEDLDTPSFMRRRKTN